MESITSKVRRAFSQRAFAALRADSSRSLSVSFAALAFPPLRANCVMVMELYAYFLTCATAPAALAGFSAVPSEVFSVSKAVSFA